MHIISCKLNFKQLHATSAGGTSKCTQDFDALAPGALSTETAVLKGKVSFEERIRPPHAINNVKLLLYTHGACKSKQVNKWM